MVADQPRRPSELGQTVLVDAGPGFTTAWWPFEGIHADTEAALASVGVAPADVDLVVVTHLDYDHAGGLLAGTWPDELGLAFPNSRVVIHQDAVAAARVADPDAPDNVGTRLVTLLDAADRLDAVSDGETIATGITVRSAPGHRVGHMSSTSRATIRSCSQPNVPQRRACRASGVGHVLGRGRGDSLETRRRVLGELADSGARTAITHGAGPHAFRVVHDGSGGFCAVDVALAPVADEAPRQPSSQGDGVRSSAFAHAAPRHRTRCSHL